MINGLSVRVCYAFIETENTDEITPTSLRGFLANTFKNNTEYHNHDGTSFLYRYPHIQYKKIYKNLIIIGLQQKSYSLPIELSRLSYINTNSGEKIKINDIKFRTQIIDITQQNMKYGFETPWIAFNSENFKKFFSADAMTKTEFLEKILVGNLLSLFKGLNLRINFEIHTRLYNLRPIVIYLNSKQFVAFRGEFETNIVIPEYLGIGKSVSKGFGTVSILKNDR